MKKDSKIVILGGGYAGLQAAIELDKKGYKSTLIDKNNYHDLLPELPHKISDPNLETQEVFSKLLRNKSVKFVQAEIQQINYKKMEVELLNKDAVPFDYVIISMGSSTNYFNIPGLRENSFTFHSSKDVSHFQELLKSNFSKAKDLPVGSDEYKEHLSIVVGGGGLTGVEVVAELLHQMPKVARKMSLNPDDVRIHLIEAQEYLLNILDEPVSKAITNYFKQEKQLDLILNCPINEVFPGEVHLKDGRVLKSKAILWTGGIRGNVFLEKTFLDEAGQEASFPLGRGFRIEVDEFFKVKGLNKTYAVGDNALGIDPKTKQAYPQNGQAAYKQGKLAAHYLVAEIEKKKVDPKEVSLEGVLVSLGPKLGGGVIMKPKTFYLPISWMSRIFKRLIELRYRLMDIRR